MGFIRGKHNYRIKSYFKKTPHDSYTELLPLTGDNEAERDTMFVVVVKKSLLTNKLHF